MFFLRYKKHIFLAFTFTCWIVGIFLMHYFERGQGWTYFETFYFSVVTTTAVGFGDLTPLTTEGRMLAMVYALFYVPLFLYIMSFVFDKRIKAYYDQQKKIEKEIHKTEMDVNAIINNKK